MPHILLVDDEPDITYIAEFALSAADFEVSRLNDPREVVDFLKGSTVDVAVLDIMMPHIDGLSLLGEIREADKLKKLSVIILSSKQLDEEETAYLNEHHAHFMSKPFETQRLVEKIRELL